MMEFDRENEFMSKVEGSFLNLYFFNLFIYGI